MILLALPLLPLLGFLLLLLAVFIRMVELRILRYAYRKIGVPPRYMFAVLVLSLVGSHVNLSLYTVGRSVVAINVGARWCRSSSRSTCSSAPGCTGGC